MAEVIARVDLIMFHWSKNQAACLDIPTLELQAGERIFLHGPSGSGKSTLLGLLSGVLLPSQGTVSVLGKDLGKLSAFARDRFRADHIGFIFQQFNLIPYLSVTDNVLLPCRFSPRRQAQALKKSNTLAQEAERLLSHLSIDSSLRTRLVTQLSVGQQQRVAAARALIGQPELVIADEPTSSLDAEQQASFLDLLSNECTAVGSTLLFVSHDHRLAAGFSREIALPSINRTAVDKACT